MKLLTKQGIIKSQTECAPNNGYFLIPLYDKVLYVQWRFLYGPYSTDRRYPSNANAKHAHIFCVNAFSKTR